tara:strand:+ start:971 stop:1429 length:459 start_codon:yes stop_codon:yes gene_type:complete
MSLQKFPQQGICIFFHTAIRGRLKQMAAEQERSLNNQCQYLLAKSLERHPTLELQTPSDAQPGMHDGRKLTMRIDTPLYQRIGEAADRRDVTIAAELRSRLILAIEHEDRLQLLWSSLDSCLTRLSECETLDTAARSALMDARTEYFKVDFP